jgi:hypothetical protein
MQFLSRDRVDGIHDNVRMDGLRIRVRGYDTLATLKHFFRASLCILLHHERVCFVLAVGREFEVVILSLSVVLIFPEPRRRFFELRGIVLVNEKVLHVDVSRLILSGNVTDSHIRHGSARRDSQ